MSNNGVIEVATGDLLQWGQDVVFVAGPGEAVRTDVPFPGMRRGQAGNPNMHRWTGAAWIEVPNVDVAERPLARGCLIFVSQPATLWGLVPPPVGQLELFNGTLHRVRRNLTFAEKMTLQVNLGAPGSANARLRVQYSADDGANWNQIATPPPGVEVAINNVPASGVIQSTALDIVNAAKIKGCLLRIIHIGGNGLAIPSFARIELQII